MAGRLAVSLDLPVWSKRGLPTRCSHPCSPVFRPTLTTRTGKRTDYRGRGRFATPFGHSFGELGRFHGHENPHETADSGWSGSQTCSPGQACAPSLADRPAPWGGRHADHGLRCVERGGVSLFDSNQPAKAPCVGSGCPWAAVWNRSITSAGSGCRDCIIQMKQSKRYAESWGPGDASGWYCTAKTGLTR